MATLADVWSVSYFILTVQMKWKYGQIGHCLSVVNDTFTVLQICVCEIYVLFGVGICTC